MTGSLTLEHAIGDLPAITSFLGLTPDGLAGVVAMADRGVWTLPAAHVGRRSSQRLVQA